MRSGLSLSDYRIGAIYRVGARKNLPRDRLVELLVDRCGFERIKADQLVTHWFSSFPYRSRGVTRLNDMRRAL